MQFLQVLPKTSHLLINAKNTFTIHYLKIIQPSRDKTVHYVVVLIIFNNFLSDLMRGNIMEIL